MSYEDAWEQQHEDSNCEVCGHTLEWTSCWQCGGEGEIDRYDDDPLWYVGPWRYQRCDVCNGEGGHSICWANEESKGELHKALVPHTEATL